MLTGVHRYVKKEKSCIVCLPGSAWMSAWSLLADWLCSACFAVLRKINLKVLHVFSLSYRNLALLSSCSDWTSGYPIRESSCSDLDI